MSNLARLTARALAQNIPLSVMFEITGRCHLDCEHCYLDLQHPPDELSTAQVLAILDQLSAAATVFLAITGGEVFLRKDLFTILGHARKLGFAVRLFTSGTRMTRADVARIAALGLA